MAGDDTRTCDEAGRCGSLVFNALQPGAACNGHPSVQSTTPARARGKELGRSAVATVLVCVCVCVLPEYEAVSVSVVSQSIGISHCFSGRLPDRLPHHCNRASFKPQASISRHLGRLGFVWHPRHQRFRSTHSQACCASNNAVRSGRRALSAHTSCMSNEPAPLPSQLQAMNPPQTALPYCSNTIQVIL